MNYQEKLTWFPFAQADRENRHCYLESSNGINPKIYAKLGFEIKKKIYLQRATKPVELDIMVRRPVMRTSTVAWDLIAWYLAVSDVYNVRAWILRYISPAAAGNPLRTLFFPRRSFVRKLRYLVGL